MGVANISGNILTDSGASLSSYLPLTGGTLTGALNGTSGTFSGQVEGTIINSTSNAFRLSGNNALSLVTLNSQSVVKINAAGFWGTQLVGANDQGILITNTGNVGIGTTSPTGTYGKLSVAGGISILDDNNAKLEIGRYSSGAANSYIKIGANSASLRITNAADSADLVTFTNAGNVGIGITPQSWFSAYRSLQIAYASLYNDGSVNSYLASNAYVGTDGNFKYGINGALGLSGIEGASWVFYNASSGTAGNSATITERMRIAQDGWVTFQGNGNGWTIGQASNLNRIDNTGSTFRCLGTNNGFTAIAASAFNVNSDYRLKEDLKDFNNSLDILKSIKIYDFKWKDKEERNYGVIAHELQEVLPYLVYGEKDGMEKNGEIKTQGVDYSKLVPVLVKAIQELSAKVTALENK